MVQNILQDVQFRLLVEHASDMLSWHDITGKLIYISPATNRMLGYSPEEMLELKFRSLVHPEDRHIPVELMQKAASKPGAIAESIYRIYHRDGRLVWFEETAQSIVDPVTGKTSTIVGVTRDVTARKEAEFAEAKMQMALIESQKRALQDLSTPIIPIMENVLVMPLIGSIDSARARDIMRNLLGAISEHRAKTVIVDITGVSIIDSGVADHLNKTVQAARLKGTRTIITGISDAIAETIIDLGIDWSNIETLQDLQSGLKVVLTELNE